MIIGEGIFLLPFVVSRIFRPTFLSVFEINNFQLGSAFSVYGLVAMGSYFLGGPIADRFSTKSLLITSLILTSLGGIFMALVPGLKGLTILYGFWGLSTILFFWAAYVKATRAFGGDKTQGMAFGSVDAGRGLFAALLASGSVFIFSSFLPEDADMATSGDLTYALTQVIYLFSAFTLFSSLLVWIGLPKTEAEPGSEVFSFRHLKSVLARRSVWMQSVIVLCAYVGYKCTDDFSLYAYDVLQFNDVNAAHVGTVSFWMRPVGALAAGLIGDRSQFSKIIMWCFGIIIIGSVIIASNVLPAVGAVMAIMSIAFICAGIYGLRGLYFTLFQEANLPLLYTGTAVGVVSAIGYTPDIFMGPLMGYVLDNNPGALGHQYLFVILGVFAIIGLITTRQFKRAVNPTA